jgi:hypothetical protein
MSKKQTRRSVSMNRSVYEAAAREARRRGETLAGLVERALGSVGVPIAEHPRQTRAQVLAHPSRVAERVAERRHDARPRRPSREREVLGDEVADAHGLA